MHFYTVLSSKKIYEAIELRRKHLGLSQAQVGELAFNRSDTSPLQNIRRGSSPSAEKLSAISEAMGLELYFGPKRDGANQHNGVVKGFAEKAASDIKPAIDGSREALRQGFLPIPYNASNPGKLGVAPIAVARSWIADNGHNPEDLSFIEVVDDKMSPGLPKGALALINGKKRPTGYEIYAYMISGNVGFARVSKPDQTTSILTFDHPLTPPLLLTGKKEMSIRMLGRVVWSGHNLAATTD